MIQMIILKIMPDLWPKDDGTLWIVCYEMMNQVKFISLFETVLLIDTGLSSPMSGN